MLMAEHAGSRKATRLSTVRSNASGQHGKTGNGRQQSLNEARGSVRSVETSFRTQSRSGLCAAPVSAESSIRIKSVRMHDVRRSKLKIADVRDAVSRSQLTAMERSSFAPGNVNTEHTMRTTENATGTAFGKHCTGSLKISIKRCSMHKITHAQSAVALNGLHTSTQEALRLTTIMQPEKSGVCFVGAAIWGLGVSAMIHPGSAQQRITSNGSDL